MTDPAAQVRAHPAETPAIAKFAGLVKFEHTLFSFPLLVAGALLGDRAAGTAGVSGLSWTVFLWILVAGTGARTFALAVNRIVDRRLDAANPRTAVRELPSGRMRLAEAWGVALAGLAAYYLAVFLLPPICHWLSPVPLAVFLGYPYLKRFTPLCHWGVGLALAMAPLAAYLAVRGAWQGILAALPLGLFAWFWVAGFDVIYATLDEAHDRAHGIHSLPAWLGRERALTVAAISHAVSALCLAVWCWQFAAGPWAWLAYAAVVGLLIWQNRSARHVELAFFQINSWLGFVVLAMVWLGLRVA